MIRIRVKKPKRPTIGNKRYYVPNSLHQIIKTKEQAEEMSAELKYLSEMSRKGTPVSASTGYRFAYGNRMKEVGPGYWLRRSFDPNNPADVKLLEMPFVPRFGSVKKTPPTEEEIRERELKECEEYWKELGVEFE